jgi:hypothetical protein
MTAAGLNVQLSFCSVQFRAELEHYIETYKPATMLLFDTFGNEVNYVRFLAAKYGRTAARPNGTVFIYRLWTLSPHNRNDGDNAQLWMTPDWLIPRVIGLAHTGVYIELLNEPNHSDLKRTCDWQIAMMNAMHPRGLKTAIGGYAFGHPEDHTNYTVFDALMRRVALIPGMALVDLHEYVRKGTVVNDVLVANPYDVSTYPGTVPDDQRWLLGRFVHWMRHLQRSKIPLPEIVIGEFGWATRGDKPDEWIPTVMGTWPVANKERFMAEQLLWAWRVLYKPWPNVIGVCLFAINDHPSEWHFSNYYKYTEARRLMQKGFERNMTTVPAPAVPAAIPQPGKYVLNKSSINLRDAAHVGGKFLFTVSPSQKVELKSTPLKWDGQKYYWLNVIVTKADGSLVEGWIAWTGTYSLDANVSITELLDQMDGLVQKMRARVG